MSSTVNDLVAWLNDTYPSRNWDQQCARLVWNAIWYVTGLDAEPLTYDPAKAAYLASVIESRDPWAAPAGAIHYWQNPAEGHVAVDIGGGLVLMTGTPTALGEGSWQCGTNYGVTTVDAYTRARRNPYLGWSRSYGQNAPIIGQIGTPPPTPTPKPKRKRNPEMSITTVYADATTPNGSKTFDAVSYDINTGEERVFQVPDASYIINVGRSYSGSPDTIVSYITRGHFDRIRAENAETRARLDARAKA